MFVEQDSYRDVVVRIENSDFLRGFVGLGFSKPMMDFSFVGKAFAALSAETATMLWLGLVGVVGLVLLVTTRGPFRDLVTRYRRRRGSAARWPT